MIRVYRVNDEEYIVNGVSMSLARVVDTMSKLGIDDSEIETGLVSLQLNDHHVADYGVFKTFIYSTRLVA